MLCFDLHAYNIAFLGYSLGKFGIFTWKYFWKAPTAEYCQSRRWRTKNGILDLVLHKYWEWIVNFIWLILTFCKTSYPLQICSCLQKILPCLLCHVDHHLVNDRRHRRTGCHSLPRFGLNPIGWKMCNQIYSCASKQPTRYTEHFNDTGWFFLLVRPIFSTKMKNDGQPIRDSVPWNSRCAKDPVQKIPKDFWYWKLGGPVKKNTLYIAPMALMKDITVYCIHAYMQKNQTDLQGCIIRSILPSGMGAHGVSLEHVENMEMFSCSPT